ncbi:MAG TPA: hypothetical protein VI319_14605 [Burkholderiales bacterium]
MRLLVLLAALAAPLAHAVTPGAARSQSQDVFGGKLETGLTYEVTRANEIKLGDGPVLLLPGDPVRKSDTYRHFAGGANLNAPCGAQLKCVANASVDSRTGVRSSEFDTAIAEGDAGVQYTAGSVVYGLRGGRQQWDVGGQSFRRVNTLVAEAVSAFSRQLSAYGALNVSRYEHPGENAFLDADYRAVTGNLRWGAQDRWQSAYTAQLTLSREDNRQQDPTLDVRGTLIRLAWDAKPAARWAVHPALMFQRLRFGDVDPLFGVRRDDRFTQAELVLNYRIGESLQMRFELMRSRYRSSAAVIDNDWSSVGAGVQWEF